VSPWAILSSTLFTTLYGITSRYDEHYPCAAPDAGADTEELLERTFGKAPGARANDGVVPTRSQIWGRVVWAGYADHLDVLGHFPVPDARGRWGFLGFGRKPVEEEVERASRVHGGRGSKPPADADARHVDWLRSGAGFDERSFGVLMDEVARGMLAARAGSG
jgi:hypothetical protein